MKEEKMGKKGSWFSAVKKALSSESRETTDEIKHKSKKKWFKRRKNFDASISYEQIRLDFPASPPSLESQKSSKPATYAPPSMAAPATKAISHLSGKSREEIAAIKIQSCFRGYMARRVLRALTGLVKFKSLIQVQNTKRQATTTLKCMQTLGRVQSLILASRIRTSEENQSLRRNRPEKGMINKIRASIGEEWDDSSKSKEQIEEKLVKKQEAAMRRERALSYASSRQQMWRNSSKSSDPTFMDQNNPQLGWSWLERWLAARPWETRPAIDRHDHPSNVLSPSHDLNLDTEIPASTPAIRLSPPRAPSILSPGRKNSKRASSRVSARGGEDESMSIQSVKSKRHRRHSIGGSSVRDSDSLVGSPPVPSYMTPTQSAKAKESVGIGTTRKRPSP